ncbi:hypothetical protein ACWGJ9_17465 [Curtobacterium citreum]
MNTEPPVGDDLERMLVAMKQNVLERTPDQAPRRRHGAGRRAGMVIGVVALLGIGATSGAVALGMVPRAFVAGPAPIATVTPEPAVTSVPSSAPVVQSPPPTSTPTRPPYRQTDPSTWTISGSEIGPVALGGTVAGETDDLRGPFSLLPSPADGCVADNTWVSPDGVQVQVVADDSGSVSTVEVTSTATSTPTAPVAGPTTAAGIGVGSSAEELHAAYPDLVNDSPGTTGDWSMWSVAVDRGTVRFQIGTGGHVGAVWIGDVNRPTAVCDL